MKKRKRIFSLFLFVFLLLSGVLVWVFFFAQTARAHLSDGTCPSAFNKKKTNKKRIGIRASQWRTSVWATQPNRQPKTTTNRSSHVAPWANLSQLQRRRVPFQKKKKPGKKKLGNTTTATERNNLR